MVPLEQLAQCPGSILILAQHIDPLLSGLLKHPYPANAQESEQK